MNKIITILYAIILLIGCAAPSPMPGPPGEQGPQGPPGQMGEMGVCSCPPVSPNVRERVVALDAAQDLQVQDVEVTLDKIPAADWPAGSRITGLWIDPSSVQQFGLTTSQLYMNVGTPISPGRFAASAPLSTPTPTIAGFEGAGLRPGAGGPLTLPLQLYVWSDNHPLVGTVGHLDLHVVVETPASF